MIRERILEEKSKNTDLELNKELLRNNLEKQGELVSSIKVLQNEIVMENEDFNKILNKKYCELYEEYINSIEFKYDTINRLKEKNMNEEYIKKYKYFAKNFIEFFSE